MVISKFHQDSCKPHNYSSQAVCGVMPKKIEELPNIDANDVGNQLAVVEYIEDIYSFYLKTEVHCFVYFKI